MTRTSPQQRKLGRPPLAADEKRGSVIIVRLRDDERLELDAAAGRAQLTLSGWIRRVLLKAAKRQR